MTDANRTPFEGPGLKTVQLGLVKGDQGHAVFLGLRVCDKPGEAAAPEGNTVGVVFTLEKATELAGMLLKAVATATATDELEGQQVVKH